MSSYFTVGYNLLRGLMAGTASGAGLPASG